MPAKVHFIDARVTRWSYNDSLPGRLESFFEKTWKLAPHLKKGEPVAVKMHFGSQGAYMIVRPALVRKIVEAARNAGGKPFVCDTVRIKGIDYLDVAASNGITPQSVNAPVVLADGLFGLDYVKVDSGQLMPFVPVASAIHDTPAMIVLSHCKGHVQAGYAGAVKNLAMGCVSGSVREKDMRSRVGRGGMHTMHRGKVTWNKDDCNLCMQCVDVCPLGALSHDEKNGTIKLDEGKCWSCCRCARVCPTGAMKGPEVGDKFQDGLAECAKGVLSTFEQGKVIYVNCILDVQPECDCMPAADVPVVQDLGILVSDDPCAVDLATCDMIEAADPLPGSAYTKEQRAAGKSAWEALHGKTGRKHVEALADLLGLSKEYELVKA